MSWAGAAVGAVYLFPFVEPALHKAIQPPLLANAVGGGAIFLVLLIILHLLSYSIADRIRGSRLRLLDRTLGLIAGLVLPAVVLSAGFLFAHESVPPAWIEGSRTKPLVEQGAKWIDELLPPELKPPGGDKAPAGGLKDLGDALPPAGQMLRPPVAGQAADIPGYRGADRKALDEEMGRRP
jgi:uncharacterized membrane protein required for colicin V production